MKVNTHMGKGMKRRDKNPPLSFHLHFFPPLVFFTCNLTTKKERKVSFNCYTFFSFFIFSVQLKTRTFSSYSHFLFSKNWTLLPPTHLPAEISNKLEREGWGQ